MNELDDDDLDGYIWQILIQNEFNWKLMIWMYKRQIEETKAKLKLKELEDRLREAEEKEIKEDLERREWILSAMDEMKRAVIFAVKYNYEKENYTDVTNMEKDSLNNELSGKHFNCFK